MGKKYIIEIPEDKIADFVGSTHFLMPYMMAGHIGHHDTGLPIAPYTEPDLEQVRNEAYQRGYEQGYKDGYNEPGKGKIKVGDEVKCIKADWTAIVTKIKEGYLTLMGNDGAIANGYDKKDFIKTGRHFPELVEVLRKMKENSDG